MNQKIERSDGMVYTNPFTSSTHSQHLISILSFDYLLQSLVIPISVALENQRNWKYPQIMDWERIGKITVFTLLKAFKDDS